MELSFMIVILNTHKAGHLGSNTHDDTMGGNKVSTSQMGESKTHAGGCRYPKDQRESGVSKSRQPSVSKSRHISVGVGRRDELSKQPEHANLNTERLRSSREPQLLRNCKWRTWGRGISG